MALPMSPIMHVHNSSVNKYLISASVEGACESHTLTPILVLMACVTGCLPAIVYVYSYDDLNPLEKVSACGFSY